MALTGQFEVLGNSETGYAFVNNEKGKVSYTFTASGTWSPDINNPNVSGCTAEGLPSLNPYVVQYFNTNLAGYLQYLKYPKNTCFSLVAQNPATGTTTEVGKKVTIVLNPGETLNFVLNDWPNDYSNNSGSIKVDYSGINLTPKVMKFDGDKDYIALPEMNIDYSGGFTVEAWVWFDSFKTYSRILELGNDAQQDSILFHAGQNKNDVHVDVRLVSKQYQIQVSSVLETGKWTHLVATIDTSGMVILYKNGQPLGNQQLALPASVKWTKNAIGASVGGWGPTRDFHGKMADVRIWNKARTQAEIQADMSKRLTGQEPALVGYWPLNETKSEGSALKVSDLSKNNLHGTITGALLVEDTSFSVY
jgi:hypothetical protein